MKSLLKMNPWVLACLGWVLFAFVGLFVYAFISPQEIGGNMESSRSRTQRLESATPWVCYYGDWFEPNERPCGLVEYTFNQLNPVKIIIWYIDLILLPGFLWAFFKHPNAIDVWFIFVLVIFSPYLFVPTEIITLKTLKKK